MTTSDTPQPTNDDRGDRLEAHLVALAQHGWTMWANTGMGRGGISGQAMTSEGHDDVAQHIVHMALQGRTITETADSWESMWPAEARSQMTRLDEEPARTGRRGPDGRPERATPRDAT